MNCVFVDSSLNLGSLKTVSLSGVDEAHKENEKLAQKGVKAYFNLDESGFLQLEKVEAHFEKSPEQVKEEEESTLSSMQTTSHIFLQLSNMYHHHS